MDTALVLQHSLVYGVILSALLSVGVIASLAWNREIWLHDYPKDVQAAYGPARRPETPRQKLIASVFVFGVLLAVLVISTIHLAQRLGGLSFGPLFLHLVVMSMTFNLVDWLIIDWLVLGVLWRDLAVMPGTDPNLRGYHDWAFAFHGFLKGSAGILVVSLVVAAVVSLLA
jgi:hypothetical protein